MRAWAGSDSNSFTHPYNNEEPGPHWSDDDHSLWQNRGVWDLQREHDTGWLAHWSPEQAVLCFHTGFTSSSVILLWITWRSMAEGIQVGMGPGVYVLFWIAVAVATVLPCWYLVGRPLVFITRKR